MRSVNLITVMFALMTGAAFADTFGSGSNQFSIDFINITGDASSANGINISQYSSDNMRYKTFVDPNYSYRIGLYEITNDQWDKFRIECGTIIGTPSYAYDANPYFTGTSVPANNISWYEAAQFINWLNVSNGYQAAYKFTGEQGTSDYTPSVWSQLEAWEGENFYRHKDTHYFLPTEDEWVKAAYWNGSSIQTYATKDDSSPQAGVDSNYNGAVGQLWNVGSGSEELNGTYDMMGNVWEWTEGNYTDENYAAGNTRCIRGDDWRYGSNLTPYNRDSHAPQDEFSYLGFRVASVAEPIECPSADLSGDCFVGIEDLSVLAQQWCSGLQNN